MTQTESVRVVRARPPLDSSRFNLLGALGAAAAAAFAYVLALSVGRLPADNLSIALFAVAPVGAAMAVPILAVRAGRESDEALAWLAAGLSVSALAMVLQLASFPLITAGGGPLGTGGDSNVLLYLIWHAAFYGAALAGAAGAPSRARRPVLATGVLITVLAAVNVFPLPELLGPRQTFTPLLTGLQLVLVAVGSVAVWLWTRNSGMASAPVLRGWSGVSLSLSTYELLLNAIAGRRFDAIWWGSLSLRVVGFTLLVAGCLAEVLRQLGRLERYSTEELELRDAELTRSIEVNDRLLAVASLLNRSLTPAQASAVVTSAVSQIDPEWLVGVMCTGDGRGPSGGSPGVEDPGGWTVGGAVPESYQDRPDVLLHAPGQWALEAEEPAFTHGEEVQRRFPAATDLPVDGRVAALPLRAGDRPVGAMVVIGTGAGAWGGVERELLTGLADQAGPVLSRALLFEREHQAAETLQRSLLPPDLPVSPGLRLAARYQPASRRDQVGGDWYDCWELPDGRTALVVGDVVGKGLDAAATMGRLRTSVRTLAEIDPGPAEVLTRLDALEAGSAPRMVATVLFVVLDPVRGRLRMARAGHLPLLLAAPGSPARLLEEGGGPPIGTGLGAITEQDAEVPDGTTLVLYTDGLVEQRGHPIDDGLDRLRALVNSAEGTAGDPDLLATRLLELSQELGGADDVALVVATTTGYSDPGPASTQQS